MLSSPLVLSTEIGAAIPSIGVIFPPEAARIKAIIDRFDTLYLSGKLGKRVFLIPMSFEVAGQRIEKMSELFPMQDHVRYLDALTAFKSALVGMDVCFNEKGGIASITPPAPKAPKKRTLSRKPPKQSPQ